MVETECCTTLQRRTDGGDGRIRRYWSASLDPARTFWVADHQVPCLLCGELGSCASDGPTGNCPLPIFIGQTGYAVEWILRVYIGVVDPRNISYNSLNIVNLGGSSSPILSDRPSDRRVPRSVRPGRPPGAGVERKSKRTHFRKD